MSLVKNFEDEEGLHFALKDVHVSVANAIRRTMLSDIPILAIRTENSVINKCTITNNTSRFHNEIVKQRLSCIPIHFSDVKDFPTFAAKYRLVVDVKNENMHELRWVTTDDFQIQDKDSEQYIDKSELLKLFPHDMITNQPIDFLRLRPQMGMNSQGEAIKLTADFSVSNAKENGMFNVVSNCAFHNVIDAEKREEVWAQQLQVLKDENNSEEEIEFARKNFNCLDAQRCFKTDENEEANEFEFIVKSIGIYNHYNIAFYACDILEQKCKRFSEDVKSGIVPLHASNLSRDLGYTSVTVSSIDNSLDVILEEEDFTLGYLIEHYLYTMFYMDKDLENEMTFIGFKKYHPHDKYSVIRMAFANVGTAAIQSKQYLVQASLHAATIFEQIKKSFAPFIEKK